MERYHNKSLNRIEFKLYSDVYNCMYRVFKSLDKKEIYVIKHDRDFGVEDFMLDILGRGPFNHAYEVRGNQVNDFAASGEYGWSLKEVCEHIQEQIDAGRR